MDYNEYVKRAYEAAKKNGFHDEEHSVRHYLMLIITEVSELVQADRKGKSAQVTTFKQAIMQPQQNKEAERRNWQFCFESFIKDTTSDEMADICIRLFDMAGAMKWEVGQLDFEKLEAAWPEHYARVPFINKAFLVCQWLTEPDTDGTLVDIILAFMRCWAKELHIDLQWHIEQKMQYNSMRGRKYGNKY